MKTLLFLLLSVVTASADVLVYSGTATETSPGGKPKAARVFFVYDTVGGRTTLLARSGTFLGVHAETTLSSQTVHNPDGRSFVVLFSSSPANETPVVQWQLTSAAYRDLTISPRALAGRLSTLQLPLALTQVIDPGTGVTPLPQAINSGAASFSDQKLTLTLDRKRTDAAEAGHWSYSEVLLDLIRNAR